MPFRPPSTLENPTEPDKSLDPSSPATPSRPTRNDIQGLRALAISMVLLFHGGFDFLKGGYIGVDVFFVISGYLITRMLILEHEKEGRLNLLAFYARRIRRLLPAASVILSVTILAIFFLYSPLEQVYLIRSFFASVVYGSNLWFAFQATDYLGENVNVDPFLHTWSLSVEEQFYLIWPLLIVSSFKYLRYKKQSNLNLMVGSVFLISLLSSLVMSDFSRPWAFFASPFRAWQFATGAFALCVERSKIRWTGSMSNLAVTLGFSAILMAGLFYNKSISYPGLYAVLPTFGTLLVILGGHHRNWFMDVSQIPVIKWLGDISYSLYLWHWPLIAIPLSVAGKLSPGERIGLIGIALVLGHFSYKYIENPIRFNQSLGRSVIKGLGLGVACTLFGLSLTFLLRDLAKAELEMSPQKAIYLARVTQPKVYEDGCHLGYTEIVLLDCKYGNITSPQTLFLFGDSHAAQWFPALEKLSQQHGYKLVSLTKSACPSAHITPYNPALDRSYSECGTWQNLVLARILRERPRFVILSNSSGHIGNGENRLSSSEWIEGMRKTLDVIRQSGAKAVIIRDTPRFPHDVPVCLSRALWRGDPLTNCETPLGQALDRTLFTLDREASKNFNHVHLIDFSDHLCHDNKCMTMINGHAAYKDGHHLSIDTVLDLSALFHKRLPLSVPH